MAGKGRINLSGKELGSIVHVNEKKKEKLETLKVDRWKEKGARRIKKEKKITGMFINNKEMDLNKWEISKWK